MRMLHVILACLMGVGLLQGCGGQEKVIPSVGEESPIVFRNTEIEFPGSIVFQSNADGDNEIYVLTRDGIRQLTDNRFVDEYPVWSPDGDWIAFSSNRAGSTNIYLMDADGRNLRAVTDSEGDDREPAWFPDGKNLAFSRESKKLLRSSLHLYRVNISSQKTRRIIPEYSRKHGIPHISPRGSSLVFTAKKTLGWDVAAYDFLTKEVRFLAEGGKSCRARFSRDGLLLAYVSSRTDGKGDIWRMAPDGSGKIRLTERDSTYDYFPAWSPEGRYLVFCSSLQHAHEGDWQLWLYDSETGTSALLYDSPGNDIFPDWK